MLATAFHSNKISVIVSVNNSIKKGELAIHYTIYLNIEFVKECGLNDYLSYSNKMRNLLKRS